MSETKYHYTFRNGRLLVFRQNKLLLVVGVNPLVLKTRDEIGRWVRRVILDDGGTDKDFEDCWVW